MANNEQLAILQYDLTLTINHKNEAHILALLEEIKAVVNVSIVIVSTTLRYYCTR